MTLTTLAVLLALHPAAQQREAIPTPPELKRLDDLDLAAADAPPGPFSMTWMSTFLGKARIAIIRGSDPLIDITDLEGKVLRSISWRSSAQFMVGASDGRLFVADGAPGPDPKQPRVTVWVADPEPGTIRPLATYRASAFDGMVATTDGGCAVLLRDAPDTPRDHGRLEGLDAQGTSTFSTSVQCKDVHRGLLGASDGGIGVVSAAEVTSIHWFDAGGHACGSVDLETPDTESFRYGSTGVTRVGDKFYVRQRSDLVVRFDKSGKKLGEFHTRWSDGLRLFEPCFCGPDDRLWTRDCCAFLRLDDDGIVEEVHGESRNVERLADASIIVGADGSIFATAPRDGAVHVLDGSGHEVRCVRPTLPSFGIAAIARGSTSAPVLPPEYQWISRGWVGPERSGKHFEFHTGGPGAPEYCIVDADGKVVRVLADPAGHDPKWQPFGGTFANDGTIAVLWLQNSMAPRVAVYDFEGNVRRAISLPGDTTSVLRIAWDGHRLAAVDDLRVWVFDEQGTLLSTTWLSEKREHERSWDCGIGPDLTRRVAFGPNPHELWVMQGTSARQPIRRYALP